MSGIKGDSGIDGDRDSSSRLALRPKESLRVAGNTRGESDGRGNWNRPHQTFWLLDTPIIIPSIQFQASTKASGEMESGDTNTALWTIWGLRMCT